MAYLTEKELYESHEQARAKRESTNADSYILRLPPELRNEIYQMCIDRSDRTRPACLRTEILLGPSTGLLHTCRFLRKEALPIFYGGNCFRVQMISPPWNPFLTSWISTTYEFITRLPEMAFACLPKVSFRLELCQHTNAIHPPLYIEVELCRNGLPAALTVYGQPEKDSLPRGFYGIKAKVQVLVDRINQRIGGQRHSGVCKMDVVNVITMLKTVAREHRHMLYTRVRSCDIILG